MCCYSQTVHRSCLKADYVGIVFHIGGCMAASIYYVFYCNKTLQTIYLVLILTSGSAVVFTNVSNRFLTVEYARLRLILFCAFGALAVVPIIHSGVIHGYDFTVRAVGLNYIYLIGVFDFGGALIFNLKIPERFAPGSFDYFGQSHQIMHFCIILGAISHYLAFVEAFTFWHGQNGECLIAWSEMDVGSGYLLTPW
ncbi:hypothetical protein HDU98_003543 [Podochytrium sp. JEL0797]|nr:hypothetical protein HDU98_003543 [Podochytrium sp. JEL0797]